MYVNKGKPMEYKEECAAFYPPISLGQFIADSEPATDVATNATVGTTSSDAQQALPGTTVFSSTATPTTSTAPLTSSADQGAASGDQTTTGDGSMSWTPWLVFAAGAVGGFFLFGKKRRKR